MIGDGIGIAGIGGSDTLTSIFNAFQTVCMTGKIKREIIMTGVLEKC